MLPSQLLILGNGFDLQCGLKSSYKDFFRSTILEKDNPKQMKSGVSDFWETLLFEYYKTYGDTDYSWCDIESIIKETLFLIFIDDKNSFGYQPTHGLWYHAANTMHHNQDPEEDVKTIKNPIHKHLFLCCADYFYKLPRSTPIDEMRNKLLNKILLSLYSFERRFCKYLKDNIINTTNGKGLNCNYIVNATNLLAQLTEFSNVNHRAISDIIHQEHQQTVLSQEFANLESVHILSFNYTALFDILLVESPCIYSNVHGKLCNKNCAENCDSSSIIFGIDDNLIQSQPKYNELRLFSKTYRKMFDTSTPKSILPPKRDIPIAIKFYGHSLSEADYSYFQSIFDYYDIYSNNNVSLIFYYSKGYEQTDAIYRLINSYGSSLSNKAQGKNLIHKLLLENRLKIVDIEQVIPQPPRSNIHVL